MNARVRICKGLVCTLLLILMVALPVVVHGQTKRTFQDCIQFVNNLPEGKACSFATVEGDQPHVRMLSLWFADEKGFYFQTESVKAFFKQMKKNNKVEICFYDPKTTVMMRVTGLVEFLDDPALKNKVLNDRPYLKKVGIKGPDDPLLALFRVSSGEAWFWTFADSMKEDQLQRIKF